MCTQSSSGQRWIRSGRTVSDSTPRACRAAGLLPANLDAARSTARSIGTPFHDVISAPTPNPGTSRAPASTLATR